jgi:chloramphenicol-sensitive protein RarD
MKRGMLFAITAYFLWGISPIYWKLIQNIAPLEIIAHRILWSFVFVLAIVWITRDWRDLKKALVGRSVIPIFLASGTLLFVNWLVYIWAVNAGFIVDASLGYFINPLVNVLLGVVFLRERLRFWGWISVGVAAFGVCYLTLSYGELPWIGLTLAFTFGIYGLLKKTAPLSSLHGFTFETGFLFLPALFFLSMLEFKGQGAFFRGPANETILLILTGMVTGIPLLLFGAAAREVSYSTIGFIQYIAPTLQFLLGVLVYGEAFTLNRMIGFGLIWVALILYSADSLRSMYQNYSIVSSD